VVIETLFQRISYSPTFNDEKPFEFNAL